MADWALVCNTVTGNTGVSDGVMEASIKSQILNYNPWQLVRCDVMVTCKNPLLKYGHYT